MESKNKEDILNLHLDIVVILRAVLRVSPIFALDTQYHLKAVHYVQVVPILKHTHLLYNYWKSKPKHFIVNYKQAFPIHSD